MWPGHRALRFFNACSAMKTWAKGVYITNRSWLNFDTCFYLNSNNFHSSFYCISFVFSISTFILFLYVVLVSLKSFFTTHLFQIVFNMSHLFFNYSWH